jgi:hypothetical protein
LRPVVAKRRVAKIEGISARRNSHVSCGILAQIGMGPMREKMLSRSIGDQSNWRMDQCAIHMDRARTMLHQLWQTPCPILPQLNVIQCTDRRMATT